MYEIIGKSIAVSITASFVFWLFIVLNVSGAVLIGWVVEHTPVINDKVVEGLRFFWPTFQKEYLPSLCAGLAIIGSYFKAIQTNNATKN